MVEDYSGIHWGPPNTDVAAWYIGTSSKGTDETNNKNQHVYCGPPISDYSDIQWGQPTPDVAAWQNETLDDPPQSIEELKMRDSQIRVDQVHDMIPFWIRGVKAAEKGEVLRMEEFLDTLAKRSSSWGWHVSGHEGWGSAGPSPGDWGLKKKESSGRGWNQEWVDKRSLDNEVESGQDGSDLREPENDSERSHDDCSGIPGDSFVEDIALQEGANPGRKRRMHRFFRLPTDEKVKIIHEMIQSLRN